MCSYKSLAYGSVILGIIVIADNKVSKGVKIRNRYNQVPHLTQDTNGNSWDLCDCIIYVNKIKLAPNR